MSTTAKKVTPRSGPKDEQMLALYRTMLTIRLTEEQLIRVHQRGMLPGAFHAYVGEEAVAAGVCANLGRSDVVFSTHRGHGHALAKGLGSRSLIAELRGRASGCSAGVAGVCTCLLRRSA